MCGGDGEPRMSVKHLPLGTLVRIQSHSLGQLVRTGNQWSKSLSGVAIRSGQDRPNEYDKTDEQVIKRGVSHSTPIAHNQV